MIIIAGALYLRPEDRDAYLAATAEVAVLARSIDGCHDFIQAADPIEAGRINIFERWESDELVERFRAGELTAPQPDTAAEPPPIIDASVHKYRISSVETP